MRIIPIIVLLLLLCGVGNCAYLKPPQPIPPHNPAPAFQQSTDTKHSGTEQFPLVVKIVPPEKSKNEASDDAKEKKDKAFNDKMLVIFTFGLVAVGVMQLIVFALQARRLRQTVEVTQKTADCMQQSERPYLFVKVEGMQHMRMTTQGISMFQYTMTFTNFGKTPAIIKEIQYGIAWSGDSSGETENTETIPHGGNIIATGEKHIAGFYEDISCPENAKIYCVGSIIYEDIFRISHHTKFCWRHDKIEGNTVWYASDDIRKNEYT